MTIRALPLRLVLLDFTTSATPDALRPAATLNAFIVAMLAQVSDDYAPFYGAPGFAMRVGSSPTDRASDEIAVNYRDTLTVQGALAYHTTTAGVPDIEIGCDLFESATAGNESITQGVSHEILELLSDRGANGWKDKQDGSGITEAEEDADPVQNTSYEKNGVSLSNFVLPSYFIPSAPGPWDFLGVMKSQDDISNGYAIRATAPSDTQQVQGAIVRGSRKVITLHGAEKLTAKQRARKASPYSRSYRRGVRL